MDETIELQAVYARSDDIVSREIEGEVIIVPLVAGIGDAEDELYTLNETGKAVWNRLDGARTLEGIAAGLVEEFDAPLEEIERDVAGLITELARRRMVTRSV